VARVSVISVQLSAISVLVCLYAQTTKTTKAAHVMRATFAGDTCSVYQCAFIYHQLTEGVEDKEGEGLDSKFHLL